MSKTSIKTAYIGGAANGAGALATGAILEEVVDTWVSQDDIRIVALELGVQVQPDDTDSNADGAVWANAQLSRSGRMDQPGCLIRASLQTTYNGVVAIGGPTAADKTVNFPAGSGVDIDSGESLNLILYGFWVGTGSLPIVAYAIVHYIER